MAKRFIDYNKNLKQHARQLRNNSTLSEVLLWKQLRAANMMGYKFNRQKPLGKYIADFYCKKLKLVIEIDGYSHEFDGAYLYDRKRQKELEALGLHILRFKDIEVKKSMQGVLRVIEDWIIDFERCNVKSKKSP